MNEARERIETIKAFYKFLRHRNYTEIRYINPNDKKAFVPRTFINSSSCGLAMATEIFLSACLYARDTNFNHLATTHQVYAGLHERSSVKGRKENISLITTLMLDIDPVRPKDKPSTNYELCLAERVTDRIVKYYRLNKFNKPVKVMSGNGYHLLFAIPPIELDESIRDIVELKIKEWNRRLTEKFSTKKVRIDSTWDLARVIKVPGTLSIKGKATKLRPHRYSYPCTPLERREDKKLLEFLKRLPLPEPETETKPKSRSLLTPPKDFNTLLESDQKLRELYEGDYSNYPSRSEAELALCCKLVWYSFTEPEIRDFMQRCMIGKWNEDTEHYHTLTLKKAFSYL